MCLTINKGDVLLKYGKWLRKKRIQNGYTQLELSKLLYVSRHTVTKWENGKSRPSVELLEEIFRIFKCTDEEIASFFSSYNHT
ncbi:MAG: helix-turn-helix domain-containing protein [Streptococcaceae bacterium]|nr:helix-turn-helix domain-containing protein [Streptococcaceae bacterium]